MRIEEALAVSRLTFVIVIAIVVVIVIERPTKVYQPWTHPCTPPGRGPTPGVRPGFNSKGMAANESLSRGRIIRLPRFVCLDSLA